MATKSHCRICRLRLLLWPFPYLLSSHRVFNILVLLSCAFLSLLISPSCLFLYLPNSRCVYSLTRVPIWSRNMHIHGGVRNLASRPYIVRGRRHRPIPRLVGSSWFRLYVDTVGERLSYSARTVVQVHMRW